MKIAVDKNQTIGSHFQSNKRVHWQLENAGCELAVLNLPFGDYCQITEEMQDTINRRGEKLKKADLVGDIKIAVDRKASIQELVGNICGTSHPRFRDEVILARKCGCKLFVLVESRREIVKGTENIINPAISDVSQLHSWKNPRLFIMKNGKQRFPTATRGITLQKACHTMTEKYGVEFLFTTPDKTGEAIITILEGK